MTLGACRAHTESECEGLGCRVVQQSGVCGMETVESTVIGKSRGGKEVSSHYVAQVHEGGL